LDIILEKTTSSCFTSLQYSMPQQNSHKNVLDIIFELRNLEEPTRKGTLLDLVLINKEGLVEDVKVGGRLGCSACEMVEFRILRGGSRAISRIKTLDLRRADFGLFKELLGGISWVRALEGRGCKSAGHSLNVTSSMLRSGASP